jgi:glycosyltransferase involved in cell wall biosynthesis
MKLLVLTQRVDRGDSVLGFMPEWLRAFAGVAESVTAICLERGEFDLPNNVRVFSLGKEKYNTNDTNRYSNNANTFVRRLRYIFKFYRLIWQERKNYTHVLVHMNPEYVVMGGLCWRMMGKRIGLWYAHGHVPFWLRLAEPLTHDIFASTKSGFRLPTKKLNIIGQGIDTEYFRPAGKKEDHDQFRIISVGRISPVKDYETLIQAISHLPSRAAVHVDIIGGAGTSEQEKYFKEIKDLVQDRGLSDTIHFAGPVANRDILEILQTSDLFVNMSRTGSLDKAMLEAMACGVPVLTCNEAMLEVFGHYQKQLMYQKGDSSELAKKIEEFVKMAPATSQSIGRDLRVIVVQDHSLNQFVKKITERLK